MGVPRLVGIKYRIFLGRIVPRIVGERIKCLIFDSEMCTLQKVGGKDSKGRRVL